MARLCGCETKLDVLAKGFSTYRLRMLALCVTAGAIHRKFVQTRIGVLCPANYEKCSSVILGECRRNGT